MDWENENWIKMYTRDTADIISIGPEGRAIWRELLLKLDRSGVIDIPDADLIVLADILRIPWEWFQIGFPKILARGMAEFRGGRLIVRNFMPAQEARSSDAQRQRDSRARRRATVLDGPRPQLPLPGSAEERSPSVMSQNVTGASHAVTSREDQIRSDESRSLAHLPVSEADLEEVYKLYPRKQGKAAGLRAAVTKITTRADYEIFRAAVERMKLAWIGQDTTYCPHFSTFVRQERWRDESLPLPGTSDRWTRQPNSGHTPAPPRERFEEADEDDLGDVGFGGLQ